MNPLPNLRSEAEEEAFLDDPRAVSEAYARLQEVLALPEPFIPFSRGSRLVAVSGRQVVKVFLPNDHVHAKTEWAALVALDDALPIPTPRPIRRGYVDEWPYVIMGRLNGVELVEVWPTLSQTERLSLAEQLGETLAVLHQTPAPPLIPRPDWAHYVQQRVDGAVERQRHFGAPEALLGELTAFLQSVDLTPQATPPAWLHTEIMVEHLLVDPTAGQMPRLSGLFDFEPSWVAPSDYELASVGLFFSQGEQAVFRRVLEAMGREPTPHLGRRVLGMALVHRYSKLAWYLERLNAPSDARLADLAQAWFC